MFLSTTLIGFYPVWKPFSIGVQAVTDVNLLGTFLMAQGAINLMKKQRSGKIINIASVYGMRSSDEDIRPEGWNNSEVYSLQKPESLALQPIWLPILENLEFK